MAQNPNPQLAITSYTGITRTLDDWATVFNLAIVVLPDRPEGSQFVPVIERIFATFGDSDVRTIVCVPSTPPIAKRIIGNVVNEWLVWCDADRALRHEPRARTASGVRAPASGHDARHRRAGLEPDRVAARRRRDREGPALDVTRRGGSGRSRAHAGMAVGQLTICRVSTVSSPS